MKTSISACAEPMDLVIVLDDSASIRDSPEDNWAMLLQFVVEIIESLSIGQDQVRASMLTFSRDAMTRFHLDRYDNAADITDDIMNTPFTVCTVFYSIIYFCVLKGSHYCWRSILLGHGSFTGRGKITSSPVFYRGIHLILETVFECKYNSSGVR